MNEANLVRRLNFLATGDGFRRCVPIDILAQVKTTAGLVLTASTVPAILATETSFLALTSVASQTHVGAFVWNVPDDYDESSDELRIRLACNMNGDTDSAKTITAAIYRKRPVPNIIPDGESSLPAGLALSADLGAPVSGAIPLLGANILSSWVEINADAIKTTDGSANRSLAATADASIKPGDCLTVVLTSGAHTTDDLDVYGLNLWYRSNLALSDINSR